jgi:putative thioredoxin
MRQRPQFPGMASGAGAGLPPSMRGVVDLGALAAKPQTPSGPGSSSTGPGSGDGDAAQASGLVYDTSDATFDQDVIERSLTVPVVLDFRAAWSQQSGQLTPVLEQLATDYGGRWVLARLDVDANPVLTQEFGVQSVPMVLAVVGGRLVPLFQGPLPESQVRQYLDELLKLAAEQGVTGTASGEPAEELPEPPEDPLMSAAYDALESNDLDGAAQALRNVLSSDPAHPEAKLALAQIELMVNTRDLDPAAVMADADARPDDVDAQISAAELDMAGGKAEEAIERLVSVVARTAGADRDKARLRLLGFFELLGNEDARVTAGRAKLMRVLF